jgi:hypothetical protein
MIVCVMGASCPGCCLGRCDGPEEPPVQGMAMMHPVITMSTGCRARGTGCNCQLGEESQTAQMTRH